MWFRSSQISGWFCPEYRFWIPLIKLRRSYLNEFRIRIRQAYKLSSAKWHFRMLPLKTIFKNFIAALPNIVSALPSFVKEVLIHMYIVRYTQKRIYGGGIGQHRSLATPVFSLDHFFCPSLDHFARPFFFAFARPFFRWHRARYTCFKMIKTPLVLFTVLCILKNVN